MNANRLHYTQEMKYLRAVADHLIELGYHVEAPDVQNRNLLDVWGTHKGKRCYIEIYATIFPIRSESGWLRGIHGIWHQGEHDGIELYLDLDPLYGLDTRECLSIILDNLKPFKKGKLKKGRAA